MTVFIALKRLLWIHVVTKFVSIDKKMNMVIHRCFWKCDIFCVTSYISLYTYNYELIEQAYTNFCLMLYGVFYIVCPLWTFVFGTCDSLCGSFTLCSLHNNIYGLFCICCQNLMTRLYLYIIKDKFDESCACRDWGKIHTEIRENGTAMYNQCQRIER
jgi:hypothetical protein